MSIFFKIILTLILSVMTTIVFSLFMTHSHIISAHPYLGLLICVVFMGVICNAFIFGKKEIVLYAFLISYPFLQVGFYYVNIFEVFAVLSAIIYCKEIFFDLKHRIRISYIIPIAIFFLSIIFSTSLSQFKQDAGPWIIFFISSALAYLVFQAYLKTETHFKKVWFFIIAVYCLSVVASCYQMVFGIESIRFFLSHNQHNAKFLDSQYRIPSIFTEAEMAGQYFAVMALALNGYAVLNLRFNLFARILSIIAIGGLMLTVTRSAIIGLFLGWVFAHIFINVRRVLIGIFGLLVILSLFKEPFFQSFIPSFSRIRFSEYQETKDIDFRFNIWRTSFPIILQNPGGVGLGGMNLFAAGQKVNAKFYYGNDHKLSNQQATTFENSYLDLLYSVGFVGFGAIIWFIGMPLSRWILDSLMQRDPYRRSSLYFLGSLLALFISASTAPLLFDVQSMMLLILIMNSAQFINHSTILMQKAYN